jgi:hypothetical protein
MVIKHAIWVMTSTPETNRRSLVAAHSLQLTSCVSRAIVELDRFSRFAFVMSVLERYRDHECTLLLNCTFREFAEARANALHELGESLGTCALAVLPRTSDKVAS